MKLKIAKIDQNIFDGEFSSVLLPGGGGEIEIFPGHAPMLSSLQSGKIRYTDALGVTGEIEIEKGFVEVNKEEVIVVL